MRSPTIADTVDAQGELRALGKRLRTRRKALGISATAAAEAAGISRVTWHRIEPGEASVAIGLVVDALHALGLRLAPAEAGAPAAAPRGAPSPRPSPLPERLRLGDHPQLRQLAWQLDPDTMLTPREALDLFERNWRHVDPSAMPASERELLEALVRDVGGGRLLV